MNTGGTSDIEAFCEMADDNFFQQFILGPTHIAGSKLDLLLCNSPEIIGDVCTSRAKCFPTDHSIVEIDIQLKFKRAKPVERQVFDYKNGKFDELRNFLVRNPINITPTSDIDNYWEQWETTFLNAVKNFVPVRTVKDSNSPPWIDKEFRLLIRKKYTALKKYRMNRSAARKRKLRSLTHQTKRLIRTKHQEYMAKIESYFSANPKLFWSYHKAILHHRGTTHHEITFKVHMQSFQILRTLIDISDKIKILFTEFKYLFLFPRYLFSRLAKSDLTLSLRRNNREIKFAPWTLVKSGCDVI